jgi:glycosyltransferase involved in cell wall biosynthesis
VVVDDGSTDNTSEVASRYPGVRCIRQENQGLAGACNTGIRHSRGSFLVFLDADDRLLPVALEAGLECFGAHPECAFVSGHYRLIAANGTFLEQWEQKFVDGDYYLALLLGNYIGMHATVMYRRAVLESVGGFDTSMETCEDYDLYFRIAKKFPVRHHNRLVTEYRQHDMNMTRNSEVMLKSTLTVLRAQWESVKRNHHYEEAYKAGIRYWRGWYGDPLVDEVRARLRKREWRAALGGMMILLRYHPRGFLSVLCYPDFIRGSETK